MCGTGFALLQERKGQISVGQECVLKVTELFLEPSCWSLVWLLALCSSFSRVFLLLFDSLSHQDLEESKQNLNLEKFL